MHYEPNTIFSPVAVRRRDSASTDREAYLYAKRTGKHEPQRTKGTRAAQTVGSDGGFIELRPCRGSDRKAGLCTGSEPPDIQAGTKRICQLHHQLCRLAR